MPIYVVRNEIVNMTTHAIVKVANYLPEVSGLIEVGQATIAFEIGQKSKYTIYTIVPNRNVGENNTEVLLRNCYKNSLVVAKQNKCTTVAFPLLLPEDDRFSKRNAFNVAVEAIRDYLNTLSVGEEMVVYIVVYDKQSCYLHPTLISEVEKYITDNFIEENIDVIKKLQINKVCYKKSVGAENELEHPKNTKLKPPILPSCFNDMPETPTFSEKVREFIQAKELTDPMVYNRINMQRQSFNRIINDKYANPRKRSAIAIAIGLELSLAETEDLLWRAGYALTNCSSLDLIVKYFIEKGRYDIIDINIALEHYGQQTLP